MLVVAAPMTADAGLDMGIFEFSQNGELPCAWHMEPDGPGPRFFASTSNFVPGDPSIPTEVNHVSSQTFAAAGEFANWIVATYPHVTSTAELTVEEL